MLFIFRIKWNLFSASCRFARWVKSIPRKGNPRRCHLMSMCKCWFTLISICQQPVVPFFLPIMFHLLHLWFWKLGALIKLNWRGQYFMHNYSCITPQFLWWPLLIHNIPLQKFDWQRCIHFFLTEIHQPTQLHLYLLIENRLFYQKVIFCRYLHDQSKHNQIKSTTITTSNSFTIARLLEDVVCSADDEHS